MITVHIPADNSTARIVTLDEAQQLGWSNCENRNDWQHYERAEVVAELLTKSTGRLHIASDRGDSVSPRYDVIEAPKLGDEVSRAFNGDYTPCGEIVRISKTMRMITTSDGTTFYRKNERSGAWVHNGVSSMVSGHIDRDNPEF